MKRLIIVIVALGLLSGCSLFRQGLVEMSKEDVKNAEAVRETADNFMKNWPINSGFIMGSLGDRIDEFPVQFLIALAELDALADKGDLTDYELGYSLGLRVRTLESLIQDTLETFAPDLMNLLPFPLKF